MKPTFIFPKHYTSTSLAQDITILKNHYPELQVSEIGRSLRQKPIFELTFGEGNKTIHLQAGIHANEWLTSVVLMDYFVRLINESQKTEIGKQWSISIVPMCNPDGVDLVLGEIPKNDPSYLFARSINTHGEDFSWWKANVAGVDLNNQFPAKWDIERSRKPHKTAAPRNWPGNTPLSEPESQALAKMCENGQWDVLISLHSQGREIYWGYEGHEHPRSEELIYEIEKVSNFRCIQNIDSHAGFRDYFLKEKGGIGLTIEMGKGVNPLPLSLYEETYEDVATILDTIFSFEISG
ncbi:MAG: M14 family zinc carboxypeptidase [Bacilli bacterium]